MPEEEKKQLANIRNIGVMAHIDAGKTTTTERILFHSGKIHKIGEVHEGKAQMDFMDQEQERGITIQSAATTVYWKDHQINIIDTPGHVDFTAEVERSLRVLDGGIVVLDGKKGVEAQTETVWRQAKKYNIPRLIFVNKMDGIDNIEKFDHCLKSISEKLNAIPLVVQFPIGAGKELKGVVDIVEQKACYFQMGDKDENYQVQEIPSELLNLAKKYQRELIEKIIEYDENLFLKYCESNGQLQLQVGEIKKLLRSATLTGKKFPVFCGSAYKHVGIKLVLDGVVDYLPSPLDVNEISVFSPKDKSKEILVNFNSNLSCLALAFKVVIDNKYNTRLTFFRIYAGEMSTNSYVYNVNKGIRERVRLVRIYADKKEEIKKVGVGDIVGATGLEHTITGDTIGDESNPLLLENISFADPVISQAIEPKTNADKDKLKEAMEKLKVQDPSFKYWIDRETSQMIIAGMGELHLEISTERLRREYKLDIETKQQKVSYRETIKNNFETWAEYKKQSGGHGHFARILVRFEPNPGKGFEFSNKIRGEAVPKKFAEAVGDGLEEAAANGLLLGYPTVDLKVSLLDGKTHPVDSSDADFKEAAILAFRGDNKEEREIKKRELGVVLLEPIMKIEVVVPKDYMGDVLANLGSRRTMIENTEEKEGESHIEGKVPLKEILSYSTILRQLTKGRGTYSMEFSHYQEVPQEKLKEMFEEEKLN